MEKTKPRREKKVHDAQTLNYFLELGEFLNLRRIFVKMIVLSLCLIVVISNLAGSFVFVGLNDITEEGVFVWTDGSPNAYAKFLEGQPDNYLNGEDCGALEEGKGALFVDQPCNNQNKFFCKTTFVNL